MSFEESLTLIHFGVVSEGEVQENIVSTVPSSTSIIVQTNYKILIRLKKVSIVKKLNVCFGEISIIDQANNKLYFTSKCILFIYTCYQNTFIDWINHDTYFISINYTK